MRGSKARKIRKLIGLKLPAQDFRVKQHKKMAYINTLEGPEAKSVVKNQIYNAAKYQYKKIKKLIPNGKSVNIMVAAAKKQAQQATKQNG